MDLPSVDGELQAFELTDVSRQTRDPGAKSGGPALSAVALSAPFVLPLTQELVADDKELAAFWAAEKDQFRYDYMTVRVGLSPNGAVIQKAWVEVLMDPGDGGGAASIAWSMSPDLVAEEQTVTEKASIKGDFKLIGGEAEVSREQQVQRWVVRSRLVNPAAPYWEFSATGNTPLDGDYKLHMVVRTPVAQAGGGTVTARVQIAGRSYMLFRREAPSEKRVGVTFSLPVVTVPHAAPGAPEPGAGAA